MSKRKIRVISVAEGKKAFQATSRPTPHHDYHEQQSLEAIVIGAAIEVWRAKHGVTSVEKYRRVIDNLNEAVNDLMEFRKTLR